MRRPILAGNWKMHMTIAEATDFVRSIRRGLNDVKDVDRVLCPPFTVLAAVRDLLSATEIGLGAQNMHWELSGAFTGEVSPTMLTELCQYVILGHSERRTYFGETDETVNRKVQAALAHELTPIVCVGETLAEYEAGRTGEVVARQVRLGLAGLSFAGEGSAPLVIAYEPVWAIGTGRAATVEGASKVVREVIRPALTELFGPATAQALRVLYGGSVNAKNAAEFFADPEIDGGLVGGASLKAAEFTQIVQAAAG